MLKNVGGDGFYVRMDVSDELSVRKRYELISSEIPYPNVLVNNVGVLSMKSIDGLSLDVWEYVLRVNLTDTFLVTKYFLPLLKEAPWVGIVNIASLAEQTDHSITSAAHYAAKGGVIRLTRRLVTELAPKIKVNAVAPSIIETDMVKNVLDTPEKRKRIAEMHPLKDIGRPEDVAEAVFFLATPKSRF